MLYVLYKRGTRWNDEEGALLDRKPPQTPDDVSDIENDLDDNSPEKVTLLWWRKVEERETMD